MNFTNLFVYKVFIVVVSFFCTATAARPVQSQNFLSIGADKGLELEEVSGGIVTS